MRCGTLGRRHFPATDTLRYRSSCCVAGEVGRRRFELAETFRGARSAVLPGVRLVCSNLLFRFSRTTDRSLRSRLRSAEKWAGADSNCGYGHPKAEGYQATPPARMLIQSRSSFKTSGSTGDAGLRTPNESSAPVEMINTTSVIFTGKDSGDYCQPGRDFFTDRVFGPGSTRTPRSRRGRVRDPTRR